MNTEFFDKAAGYLPDVCFNCPPDLGVMLGSGWGEALEMDEVITRISYADIPGLGASTVQGHAGEFVLYKRGGKLIAAWCGRRHYYEGVGWEPVVLPVEILRRMGCQNVLLTNAAGGINAALKPGDFVILHDHIDLHGLCPLVGPHNPNWGARFPDMCEVYTKHLADTLRASANRLGLRVLDGVYGYTSGPAYETPAEVRAYKTLGADVVGMSTVPEAIIAHASGLKVAAISLVTNLAAGISPVPLSHTEVMAAGEAAKPNMRAFIEDFMMRL